MRFFQGGGSPPASGCSVDPATRGLPADAVVPQPRSATASTSPAATRRAPVVRSRSVRVCIACSRCEGLSARAVGRPGGCCRRRRIAEGCCNCTRRRLIDIPLERSEESAADLGPRVPVRFERRETLHALLRPRVVEPPPDELEVLLVDRDRLRDRKSTRLNSSHSQISYAVFCLK